MARRYLATVVGLGMSLIAATSTLANDANRPATMQTPQSIKVQHAQILNHLGHIAAHKGPQAATADRALILLKSHYAKEEEEVLPALALLDHLDDATVPEARSAIAMADRTAAAREEFYNEHVRITSLMNDLIEGAKKSHDAEVTRLATQVAGQSLNDIEINQPMVIFIGKYLKAKVSKSAAP